MTSPGTLRARFLNGLWAVFSVFQAPSPATRVALSLTLLVQDSTTLLVGLYGAGKTLFVQLVRRTFFAPNGDGVPDFGWVACTQDLTPMDTLFSLDLGRLTQGEEVVSPRAIVTARLKFVNEIQRANALVYNSLLPLFSEKTVVFRDQEFTSPAFLAYLDANPHDAGSSEMPAAFLDRIDFSVRVPIANAGGLERVIASATGNGRARWNELAALATPMLTGPEMEGIWRAVRAVPIDQEARMIAVLVAAHLQRCARVDRSVASPDFDLRCGECSFKGNACAKLTTIPGNRFVLSTLKLAQGRAWLRGARAVDVNDVLFGLPYTLAHRLRLRPDVTRLYPGAEDWIVEELYRAGVRPQVPRWRQVIRRLDTSDADDRDRLLDLARRDLAVAHLLETRHRDPDAAGFASHG